ncbi:TPA: hypothetical protein KPJ62_002689 [Clostridioides difficile]|nr:hypothetical protein [Clostridioides difficile]
MLTNIFSDIKCVIVNDNPYVESTLHKFKNKNHISVKSIIALDDEFKLVSPYLKFGKRMILLKDYALENNMTISEVLDSGDTFFYKYDSFTYLVSLRYHVENKKLVEKSINISIPVDFDEEKSALLVYSIDNQFPDILIKSIKKLCKQLILKRGFTVKKKRI